MEILQSCTKPLIFCFMAVTQNACSVTSCYTVVKFQTAWWLMKVWYIFGNRMSVSINMTCSHGWAADTSNGSNSDIEAETRWTTIRRPHFQTSFLQWKGLNFYQTSLKFVPNCLVSYIPALVKIMAWRCQGDKPLTERIMFTDAYMRHLASMGDFDVYESLQ